MVLLNLVCKNDVVFVEAGTLIASKLKASLQDILPYSLEHQDTDYDGTLILSNILLEHQAVKSLGGGRKSGSSVPGLLN